MNKETKNKEAKKFNKYYILVFLLILVIGIMTATYAFFQIDTDSSEAKANITADAGCFEITFEDLSEDEVIKLNANYPITDEYALGKTDSIYNLKPVVVKVSNNCTQTQDNLNYKLAITTLAKDPVEEQDKGYIPDNKVRYNVKKVLNKETEEDSESLRDPDYLNSLSLVDDANIISILNEEITKKGINLNNYDTVNTYIIDSDSLASNTYSTYYLRLWIDYYEGDSEAYTNPEGHESKTYPCDNEDGQCKYDNSTKDQKFESVISLIADGTTSERPKSTIDILREKDIEVSGGVEHLSPLPNQGGMYRYQGTDDVPNWILFGTRDKCEKDAEEKCTNITDSDGNKMPYDDYIDKYMYRIIGITEEGQMYLIKETFLKEGSVTGFAWNDKYNTSSSGNGEYVCENKICPEWGQNTLFKRLNGTSNGEIPGYGSCNYSSCDGANTDIFVDSEEYDYLKSGDINSGGDKSEWYTLIADHYWMYGDVGNEGPVTLYKGGSMYEIETAQRRTYHYVKTEDNITEELYTWSEKVNGKISLMYVHDVDYAYYDGLQNSTRGNPYNKDGVKESWIHFLKDGYNSSLSYEWLSTRWGLFSEDQVGVAARRVTSDGNIYHINLNPVYDFCLLNQSFGVRPVFYLESTVQIAEGDGTKDSPFILSKLD